MAVAQKLLTANEFAALPERDDAKLELVRGEVVLLPPPGGQHGEAAGDAIVGLKPFVVTHGLGKMFVEAMFRLSANPDTVRIPDVSFLAAPDLPPGGVPEGYLEGAPTLAIEVTMSGDLDSDLQERIADYLAAGTKRVWVLRPKRKTVMVHRPDGTAATHSTGYILSSDDAGFETDGLQLPVQQLFAP